MNDATHDEELQEVKDEINSKPWKKISSCSIAFDLDGTLALYDTYRGDLHIGDPIPQMVRLLKIFLNEGFTVKILTARAYKASPEAIKAVEDWCLKHIGQVLEVTCMKDPTMLKIFDDRAVQVIKNVGLKRR